jgi:hypothetical protein
MSSYSLYKVATVSGRVVPVLTIGNKRKEFSLKIGKF